MQLPPVRPPEDSGDPQQQLLHQKGLGHIIIRPQPQTEQPVAVRVPGGQKQNGDVASAPNLPEQAEPVAVRQIDVQNHQFRQFPGNRLSRGRSAVRHAYHAIARPRQFFLN